MQSATVLVILRLDLLLTLIYEVFHILDALCYIDEVDVQLRREFPGLKGGAVGTRRCAMLSGYLCEWVIGRRPLCKAVGGGEGRLRPPLTHATMIRDSTVVGRVVTQAT
jgi:hypothetical protein